MKEATEILGLLFLVLGIIITWTVWVADVEIPLPQRLYPGFYWVICGAAFLMVGAMLTGCGVRIITYPHFEFHDVIGYARETTCKKADVPDQLVPLTTTRREFVTASEPDTCWTLEAQPPPLVAIMGALAAAGVF